MIKFKFYRSVRVNYIKQGKIFFDCLSYALQPENVRKRIDDLCREVGGEYEAAVREMMTTRKSMELISMDHYINTRSLIRFRKRFFELYEKRYLRKEIDD